MKGGEDMQNHIFSGKNSLWFAYDKVIQEQNLSSRCYFNLVPLHCKILKERKITQGSFIQVPEWISPALQSAVKFLSK